MSKRTVIAAMLTLMAASLHAQTMGFLNINSDPVAAGMASTSVAASADAFAPSNNMASSALSSSTMAVAASYSLWQPKAQNAGIISASGFYKIGDRLAVGADFKNLAGKEYKLITGGGNSNGTFTPRDMAIGLGASYGFAGGFAAGLKLKFASSQLAPDAKAATVAADLSVKYEADSFHAGLSLDNLGGKVSYGSDSYSLPMMVRGGAAYSVAGLTGNAELSYLLNGGVMASLGAQYSVKDIVFVRAGFHYGDSAKAIPSYGSLGLGFSYAGFGLNAAYILSSGAVGNSIFFGIGYSF